MIAMFLNAFMEYFDDDKTKALSWSNSRALTTYKWGNWKCLQMCPKGGYI